MSAAKIHAFRAASQPHLYTQLNLFTLFHLELHPVFETLGYAGGYAIYRAPAASKATSSTTNAAGW